MGITAASSYLKYGWETAFKTASTNINKVFGVGQKITNRSENQNLERRFTVGQRQAEVIVPKAFEGALTVEFWLSNSWFLRGVFGNTPNHVAGTPDIWYYVDQSNNSGLGALTIPDTLPSMTILNSINLDNEISAGNSVFDLLLGSTIDTCTMTANQGEVVVVSNDIKYADVSHNIVTYSKGAITAGGATASVVDTYDPYTFAHGEIKYGADASGNGGTVIANVQSLEFTVKNNVEYRPSIGGRTASAKIPQHIEFDVKMTALFSLTRELLERFYGTDAGTETFTSIENISNSYLNGPSGFSLSILFDNGLTLDNQRAIQIELSGLKIGERTLNQAVEEPIVEELTCLAVVPTYVVAKNAATTEG